MTETRFNARRGRTPAMVTSGDKGGIWKCFNLLRQSIGYLVAGGKNCNTPVAYVGISASIHWNGREITSKDSRVGLDLEKLFEEATVIAADFSRASIPSCIDLRGVDMKDIRTIPSWMFRIILRPTNGTFHAVRYGFAGACLRPFQYDGHEQTGAAMFHAYAEEGLPSIETNWRKTASGEKLPEFQHRSGVVARELAHAS